MRNRYTYKALLAVILSVSTFTNEAQNVVMRDVKTRATTGGLVCEATEESLEAAGLSADFTEIKEGTILAEGEAGSIATAYHDNWRIIAPSGSYRNVMVGDVEVNLSYGASGSTNPVFVTYEEGCPTAGAVFKITPSKDGWLTLFTKMNPNKAYVVFEGRNTPLSYTLGYFDLDPELGPIKIHYTLPFDPKTYSINFNAPDASRYFVDGAGDSPEQVRPRVPWMASGLFEEEVSPSNSSNNTGFLTFNVVKGNTYYFSALGAKAPCGTFILTDEQPIVVFEATEDLPEVIFDPEDIKSEAPSIPENPDNPETPEIPDYSDSSILCEATAESLEAVGLVSGEKIAIKGGTVFAKSQAGNIATAYDDMWGIMRPSGSYNNVKVDDIEVRLSYGVVGTNNPSFISYADGIPTAGAVFKITPNRGGWLTVFTKLNIRKQYIVCSDTKMPMAYTLGWAGGDSESKVVKIFYSLPSNSDGSINFTAPDAAKYFVEAGGYEPNQVKPQFPLVVGGLSTDDDKFDLSMMENTGFLTFKVEEGQTYYFSALGAKAPCGTFVLTDEQPIVVFEATEDLPEVIFDPEEIESEIPDIPEIPDTPENPTGPNVVIPDQSAIRITGEGAYYMGDMLKIRENNLLNLSVTKASGGYENSWVYIWKSNGNDIGDSPDLTTYATMPDGYSREIYTNEFDVSIINYAPNGSEWASARLFANPVYVYRRPQTPSRMLKKGNGTSCTFIVMYDNVPDSTLTSQNYINVYGYTDANGIDHEISSTSLRYLSTYPSLYNDNSNRFWVYALWNYDDGSIVSSGLRYLDGEVNEDFDASGFMGGNSRSPGNDYDMAGVEWITDSPDGSIQTAITVYNISGTCLMKKVFENGSIVDFKTEFNLQPGIYLISVDSGNGTTTKKIRIQ
ncbi:MAG: T9SS type A sorting domain-containing protein [Muribaculaceae bacterium]|nr:T9SS type A sorting domain-containing protein [Muribaculaceae bacterium]